MKNGASSNQLMKSAKAILRKEKEKSKNGTNEILRLMDKKRNFKEKSVQ